MANSTLERPAAFGHALRRYEPALRGGWMAVLGMRGDRAAVAREHVANESTRGEDLLSLVIACLHEGEERVAAGRARVAAKVRRPEYSINDLMVEVTSLARAVGQMLEAGEVSAEERQALMPIVPWLQDFFFTVLGETVSVYEHLIETGAVALCQLGSDGRITHANVSALGLLGDASANGKKLRDFFAEEHCSFIEDAVAGDARCTRDLALSAQADGPTGPRILTVEIGPIEVLGERAGAFAVLRDVSEWAVRERLLLEQSPLGMLKVDDKQVITYANPIALQMIGVDQLTQCPVRDILADDDSIRIIERHLARRKSKESSEYDVEICAPGQQEQRVSVRVVGIPILNALGEYEGSLGIVRDRTILVACEQVHDMLKDVAEVDLAQPGSAGRREREEAIRSALAEVAEIVRRLVPFDLMMISRFSPSGRFVRPEFQYPEDQAFEASRGWFWMSDNLMQWNRCPELECVEDLEVFLNEHGAYLRDEPMVTSMLDADLRSFVKIPIGGAQLHAVVSFWRTGASAFGPKDVEVISQLPFGDVVRAMLAQQDRDFEQFRYDLLRKLIGCQSLDEIAHALVEDIGERFQWNHVTVFEVDREAGELSLRAQGPSNGIAWMLDEDYAQPLGAGVMGQVLRSEDATGVNLGDTRDVPAYIGPGGDVRPMSELCLPVSWEASIRWLFNVEDTKPHAFSDEEHEALKSLMQEVGAVLGQMATRYRLQAAVMKTSDAVFFISPEREVQWLNPAAEALLGWRPSYQQPKRLLDDFLPTEAFSRSWLQRTGLPSREETLVSVTGERHDVLMSVSRMPRDIPGWVLAAKDLAPFRQLERFEALGTLLQEVSAQAQTPMSLLFEWLRELRDDPPRKNMIREYARRSLNQLHKVQVTLERMALHEGHERLEDGTRLLLDLPTELARSMAQFPQSQREFIDHTSDPVPPVLADPFQIGFVITTLLSHVTRFRPRTETVSARITAPDPRTVQLEVAGEVPALDVESYQARPELAAARAQLRLGEVTLRFFIERSHKGRFEIIEESGITRYRVQLPAQRENAQ